MEHFELFAKNIHALRVLTLSAEELGIMYENNLTRIIPW